MKISYNSFRQKTLFKITSWVLLFGIINLTSGCSYTYKTFQKDTRTETYNELLNPHSYVIVHASDEVFHISVYGVSDDLQIIVGTISDLPKTRRIYKITQDGKGNVYHSESGYKKPEGEIHLYVSSLEIIDDSTTTIPYANITGIKFYKGGDGALTVVLVAAAVIAMVYVVGLGFRSDNF